MGGKDASKQFWKYHNESILKKFQPKLKLGSLDSKPKAEPAPAPVAEKAKPVASVAPTTSSAINDDAVPLDLYGDLVPYADPNWYQSVRAQHMPMRQGIC
jgi:hypothetical protein